MQIATQTAVFILPPCTRLEIRYLGQTSSTHLQILAKYSNILITASGYIDDDNVRLFHLRCALDDFGHGMRGLQGRDNSFGPRQHRRRFQSLCVACSDIFRAARVVQPRMLRTDGGIIQACRDRMR